MKNRSILSFVFLSLINFQVLKSQNAWQNLSLLKSIDIQANLISTDKLGNLYISTNQEVFKYDVNGNLLQKNSLKNWGNLFSLDVSNPMKILAFYKDYNKIIFLDNMIAPSGNEIDLSSIGFDQATLACTSHDNGFWIYNSLNFELVRMDPSIKITNQSGNIAQLTGNAIKPIALIETNNKVYLCDSTYGILIFDVFGTFIKTIPIPQIHDFQVENNIVYFIDLNGFGSFNMELLQRNQIELPKENIKQIRLQKNRVYLRMDNKVSIESY